MEPSAWLEDDGLTQHVSLRVMGCYLHFFQRGIYSMFDI